MEVIHIRLHPDNINKDNGIDIPEARIPTIKKHNGRPVRKQTAEGTTWSQTSRKTRTHRNNGDRNPPIALDRRDANGRKSSRPHRLMKTNSKQSKRRDLPLKWLPRETND